LFGEIGQLFVCAFNLTEYPLINAFRECVLELFDFAIETTRVLPEDLDFRLSD
jgi:hypothetical protein